MKGRLLVAFLTAAPFVVQAAPGCHGQPYGDVAQRFSRAQPLPKASLGVPEGIAVPLDLVSMSGGGFGCDTSWTVDIDTGHAWERYRCDDPGAFDQRDFSRPAWTGVHFNSYTDDRGRPAREAVREGTLAPTTLEKLVCLANDAWSAASWGGGAQQLSLDGFGGLLITNGSSVRSYGSSNYPIVDSPDGRLRQAVRDAVETAVTPH